REHAGVRARRDARLADDALRGGEPGDPVPRRGASGGLAATAGGGRDRGGVLPDRARPLPRDAEPDGIARRVDKVRVRVEQPRHSVQTTRATTCPHPTRPTYLLPWEWRGLWRSPVGLSPPR